MKKGTFVFVMSLFTIATCAVTAAYALNFDVHIEGLKTEQVPGFFPREGSGNAGPGAPEPNTLILLFGGFTGVLLRFARKSFEEIKRIIDIVLSMFGLMVSLPLLAYAMLMVKYDSPGPVFYKQRRVGKDGTEFEIFKLRTMRYDAEKHTGAVWAKKNDPRVTPAGRIFRKLRIDEVPQLYNVLRGEMSLIGPRPERPEIVNQLKGLIADYEKRLSVKPGITGLAQVLYKYDETLDDVRTKVGYDRMYMRTMSITTDLQILARTFLVVATGRGAR